MTTPAPKIAIVMVHGDETAAAWIKDALLEGGYNPRRLYRHEAGSSVAADEFALVIISVASEATPKTADYIALARRLRVVPITLDGSRMPSEFLGIENLTDLVKLGTGDLQTRRAQLIASVRAFTA